MFLRQFFDETWAGLGARDPYEAVTRGLLGTFTASFHAWCEYPGDMSLLS